MLLPMEALSMFRTPRQQIKRMRQQRQDRPQRTLRPRRAARQVHDQCTSQRPADRPAQRRQRRTQQPLRAHPLRQPIHQPVTDQPRGLRSHVPRRQPRPSRRHDQSGPLRMTPQRRRNQIKLIRQRLCHRDPHASSLQQQADSRSRQVDLLPPEAAVTDRQHNGTNIGRKCRDHAPSLRVSSPVSETSQANHFFRPRHQR